MFAKTVRVGQAPPATDCATCAYACSDPVSTDSGQGNQLLLLYLSNSSGCVWSIHHSWNTAVVCDVDHCLNHSLTTWNELGWCCIIILLFTVFSATFKWLRWWMIIPCVLMVVIFNDWCLHSLPDDSEESTFPVHLTPASSPRLQLCTNRLRVHYANTQAMSFHFHYI